MFKELKNMIFGNLNMMTNQSRFGGNMNRSRSRFIYNLTTFEDARKMIDNNEVILLDVRSKSEYDAMRVRNSINIPVDELEKGITNYPTSQKFMIYCSSGSRSKTAIQILNNLGYQNIYIWEYASLATFPYKDMLEYSN